MADNPTKIYNDFVRANLPTGMSYDSNTDRYDINNHSFFKFKNSNWYYRYISKYGYSATTPIQDLLNTLLVDSTQLIAHPLEYGSMFQDRAGSIPVTAPGQLVGMVLDHGFTGSKPVLGPELVTNGTFDSDTSGWSVAAGTATLSVIGGQLAIQADALDNPVVEQQISTVVGKAYRITANVSRNDASQMRVAVGSQSGQVGNYFVYFVASETSIEVIFVATSATSYVSIRNLADNIGDTVFIDNISVRELPGYHATAISDAARGVYAVVPETGRRNLLEYTEDFDNAAWVKLPSISVTSVGDADPSGGTNATRFTGDGSSGEKYANQSVPADTAGANTVSAFFKEGTERYGVIKPLGRNVSDDKNDFAVFDLRDGIVTESSGLGSAATMIAVGDGWYRCTIPITAGLFPSSTNIDVRFGVTSSPTSMASTASGYILTFGAQLELGSTATAYQKVVSEYEVTEAGVPSLSYISYNGVNTAYETPALPAPLVDKAQVFAGVRKLSDAAQGIVSEFSPSIATNNGAFALSAPNSAADNLSFESKGITLQSAIASGYVSPITNVLTGTGDISGDLATLRIDGTQVAQNIGDQGTGNYNPAGTSPLYYGGRAGTSLFFNGRHYDTLGPITRFSAANATTEQIEAAEAYYTARVI